MSEIQLKAHELKIGEIYNICSPRSNGVLMYVQNPPPNDEYETIIVNQKSLVLYLGIETYKNLSFYNFLYGGKFYYLPNLPDHDPKYWPNNTYFTIANDVEQEIKKSI